MADVDYATMPDRLPEKPTGWTTRMMMHLNFGGGHGAMSSTVHDPAGREMPFGFVYNTKEKIRGFTLCGVEPIMTWQELRAIWPRWIARARAKQKAKHG